MLVISHFFFHVDVTLRVRIIKPAYEGGLTPREMTETQMTYST